MGLGKHFYTMRNEGKALSVREQSFFGVCKKKVSSPKVKSKLKPKVNKNLPDILEGLI